MNLQISEWLLFLEPLLRAINDEKPVEILEALAGQCGKRKIDTSETLRVKQCLYGCSDSNHWTIQTFHLLE